MSILFDAQFFQRMTNETKNATNPQIDNMTMTQGVEIPSPTPIIPKYDAIAATMASTTAMVTERRFHGSSMPKKKGHSQQKQNTHWQGSKQRAIGQVKNDNGNKAKMLSTTGVTFFFMNG